MQEDRFAVSELMTSAACAAIARYEALKEPHKDKLPKREAEDYIRDVCTKMGIYMPRKEAGRYIEKSGAVILKIWESDKLIKGERGKSTNSPIKYSKSAIIEVANIVKIKLLTRGV